MSNYIKVKQQTVKKFTRLVGVNKKAFEILCSDIKKRHTKQKELKPISKRGKKPKVSIEDQLLLTMYYLRNYHTFFQLGLEFGISEGYANKIFHKIKLHLVDILRLPPNTELSKESLKLAVVDVSEQPIERPVKGQKDYYSGKKNDTP